MKENYITAVLAAFKTESDPDAVLRGLTTTLKRRGHEQLYGAILRGVARVLDASSTNTTTITVTSQAAYETQQAAISAALRTLGVAGTPELTIDETIIGGFIVEANDLRLDKSYKSKLVTLYRSLTN